jgi:serine/threonine-protein kinase
MSLAAGTQLGHYHVLSPLGAGGMGEVYLAQDTKLDRKVALKMLPAELASDKERMQRFIQEAKTVSALNHPNILTVHEIGQAEGMRFIVTEYIDGVTLREHIRSRRVKLHEVLDIVAQVAAALDAAHEAKVVHRDIKPENIMLRRRDHIVKVLDFGLAKPTRSGEGARSNKGVDTEAGTKVLVHTEPGMVMGTVAYMSPEQSQGSAHVDLRTDIWSLGVVLYELVAGRVPFEGKDIHRQIIAIQESEPMPVSKYAAGVPDRLEEIIEKSLAKDTDDRYQTAKDLLIDLRNLKRRLEVDAEIERTVPPELRSATSGANAGATRAASSKSLAHTGPVERARPTSSAEYIVNEITHHKRGATLALATLLVAAAGLLYFFGRGNKAAIGSVAVLPFDNVSKDPATEYLSDGITESLIDNLSQLPQLKVIARSSSFKYKGKEIDPEEVAKTLGVAAIVTGRIIQHGEDLQIGVELTNALDKTQIWGEQYNRRAEDLQAVQAEIAHTISEKLRLRLTGAQEQRLTKQATTNPQAYQLYLNGVFYFRKGNIENFQKALDYYNQAVTLDPKFALAYADMPAVYANLTASGADPKELLAKAKRAAQKALELDETLAEAHSGLATIERDEWDWPGAEKEFRRAIELNPNLAAAHSGYAIYLSQAGRASEALAEIKRAEELDPLRVGFRTNEALDLYFARRYDEAIQVLQDVIKTQPDFSNAHAFLGYTYAAKGQYAEAIKEYRQDISLDGETTSTLCYLGYALAMSGKRDEAQAVLNKLKATKEYVSPGELAALQTGLGDKEAALQSLERAYTEHDLQMQYLKVEPHYDALRPDPRFQELLRRMNFPQ